MYYKGCYEKILIHGSTTIPSNKKVLTTQIYKKIIYVRISYYISDQNSVAVSMSYSEVE